ncbi:hypothetical protein R3P38DRAFT_2771088 [Favolaschia claudopus]|uniref:Uncharacterized protein n=1 Tax=Favolaschia claudopus TaxID=2862362 RepID=A0AAW0CGU3_9AGAR
MYFLDPQTCLNPCVDAPQKYTPHKKCTPLTVTKNAQVVVKHAEKRAKKANGTGDSKSAKALHKDLEAYKNGELTPRLQTQLHVACVYHISAFSTMYSGRREENKKQLVRPRLPLLIVADIGLSTECPQTHSFPHLAIKTVPKVILGVNSTSFDDFQ